MLTLENKTILITGAALRIGRAISLAAAREGAYLIIHYRNSLHQAQGLQEEISQAGGESSLVKADFSDAQQLQDFSKSVFGEHNVDAVINNASIFTNLDWNQTSAEDWRAHLDINLGAPFIISQAFARSLSGPRTGRIINMLDWRALRPGADHLPYTISKAGLAALTKSLAVGLAPQITVNGIALGAVLPPLEGDVGDNLVANLPIPRWAELSELEDTIMFLLTGPTYITGEIIHLDGGRHLI